MSKTEELAARQQAALAKNQARKEKIEQLQNVNSFLEQRVKELEEKPEGGLTKEEADELRAELGKSNELLQELQDAVLDDGEPEPEPENPNGETPPPAEPPAAPPAEQPAEA